MTRPRLLHFGAFDHDNYGDLLFPLLLEKNFAGTEADIVHVSPTGGSTPWKDARPSISFTDAFSISDSVERVIVGGGDIILEGNWSPPVGRDLPVRTVIPGFWLGASAVAERLGAALAWNAPGVPEVFPEWASPHLRQAIANASYLAVRDPVSARNLKRSTGMDAVVVPDSAWALPQLWSAGELAGVANRFLAAHGLAEDTRTLAIFVGSTRDSDPCFPETLGKIVQVTGLVPVLIEICPWQSRPGFLGELVSKLGRKAVALERPDELRLVAALIAGSSLYVGESLHGLITAAAYGKPALVVPPMGSQNHKYAECAAVAAPLSRSAPTWEAALALITDWKTADTSCAIHDSEQTIARLKIHDLALRSFVRATPQNQRAPFALMPAEMARYWADAQTAALTASTLQLFWATGTGDFSFENSVSRPLATPGRTILKIPLPNAGRYRLDPTAIAGFGDFKLTVSNPGEESTAFAITDVHIGGTAIRIPSVPGRIWSYGNDPQIHFTVPVADAAGARILEIELHWLPVVMGQTEEDTSLVHSPALESARIADELTKLNAKHRQVLDEAEALRAKNHELDQSLSAMRALLDSHLEHRRSPRWKSLFSKNRGIVLERTTDGFRAELRNPGTVDGEEISRAWVKVGRRRIPLVRAESGFSVSFTTGGGWKLLSLVVKDTAGATHVLATRLRRAYSAKKTLASVRDEKDADLEYRPLISVIVPNYNHATYLPRRLESIYDQTYPNFEVILLDDASTDESQRVLETYVRRHPNRTRLVANKNNGGSPFSQWTKGMDLARGDIIWIAESDDYCDSDFLEKLVPAFRDEAVMLAYGLSKFVDTTGRETDFTYDSYVKNLSETKWRNDHVAPAHEEVRVALGIQNTIPNASGALFRKPSDNALLMDEEWLRMRVCGDWMFYLSVIRGGKIAFVRSAVNYYRQHPRNTSTASRFQPTYYREHEQVAGLLARLYAVSDNLLKAHRSRLEEQWQTTFPDKAPETWTMADCYALERVAREALRRLPNVLVVCHDFSTGGGEIFAIRLAIALKTAGFGVTFYDFCGAPGRRTMRNRLPHDIPLIQRDPRNPIPLDHLVDDLGIEIINTHHSSCEWMFAQAIDRREKAGRGPLPRLVATLHGMHNLEEETLLKHRQILQKHVAHWVYVADRNVEPLINQGLHDPARCSKIPTGIFAFDPDTARVTRKALGIPEPAFVVCVASRAIPEKGWSDAVEVVRGAREATGRDIHLLLVGDGPVRHEFSANPLPAHIHMPGFREDVVACFALSDVGMLSSTYRGESAPLCVIECLSTGRPVLATDCGEIANMLTPETGAPAGVLVSVHPAADRIEQLTRALSRMASDADFHRELASRAAPAMQRYLMTDIGAAYARVFTSLPATNTKS